MGRGSRGRGRGSMGDHPEDEDDFYEDEMDVSFLPLWRWGVVGGLHELLGVACKTYRERKRETAGLHV